jgi:hypothetical protein
VMLRWNACARPNSRAASGRRAVVAAGSMDKHFMPLMPIIWGERELRICDEALSR